MTILELFKKVHPSVLAAKMIFKHLQDNYPVLKISDIADTSSGGTPNRGMIEYYNGKIPWIKSGELKDGIITTCDEFITESGLKNSSAKLFPKGTLLVAMYGANIGKTGVLDFDATTNQAVCAIFPKIDISKDFLFWYFKQQRIEFIAIGKGGAQPNISQTVINNALIVVPEPKIQKKIVDFLEAIEQGEGIDKNFFIPEVLEDIERIYKYKNSYNDLSDSFENQLSQIENLNQAILQEAVQGKLVNQDPKDEPASELLKRIKFEKAKSGKKDKPLSPIKPDEIPFEIPQNWLWCRLNEIYDVRDGTHNSPKYYKDGYPFITSKNLVDGKLDFSEVKKISEKDHLEFSKRSKVEENDILFAMIGTIGNPVIVPKIENEFSIKNVALLKNIAKDLIDTKFVFWFLVFSTNEFKFLSRGGIQKFVSLHILRNKLFPLPPFSEQIRIVEEIESQLTKTKQLKEHIISNQQATEQLLKALLHQAFEVRAN